MFIVQDNILHQPKKIYTGVPVTPMTNSRSLLVMLIALF